MGNIPPASAPHEALSRGLEPAARKWFTNIVNLDVNDVFVFDSSESFLLKHLVPGSLT